MARDELDQWLKRYVHLSTARAEDQAEQPRCLFLLCELHHSADDLPTDKQRTTDDAMTVHLKDAAPSIVGFCVGQEQLGDCLIIDMLWLDATHHTHSARGQRASGVVDVIRVAGRLLLAATNDRAREWGFCVSWTMARKYVDAVPEDTKAVFTLIADRTVNPCSVKSHQTSQPDAAPNDDAVSSHGGRYLPAWLHAGHIDVDLMTLFEQDEHVGKGVCETFVLHLDPFVLSIADAKARRARQGTVTSAATEHKTEAHGSGLYRSMAFWILRVSVTANMFVQVLPPTLLPVSRSKFVEPLQQTFPSWWSLHGRRRS